ncbi:hypothetical protein [Chitinibacter tainanensis]|uniref:hypothetical protein n=1 Tax=Chitinibacter tainanensis TaxID=230667 RepID=UPI00048E6A12|nr:hypothetical protein [Chitinibacter tainanensis]
MAQRFCRVVGGDNNDQLAIYQGADRLLILLGLKTQVDVDSDLQLDTQSLGAHLQFSNAWMRVLIFSLQQSTNTMASAQQINDAWHGEKLGGVILYLRLSDESLHALPLEVEADGSQKATNRGKV